MVATQAKICFCAVILAVGFSTSAGALEALDAYPDLPSVEPLLVAQSQLLKRAVTSQKQVNDIVNQRMVLLTEYRKIHKELDIQALYNQQLSAQIQVQEAKKKELKVSIQASDRLQQQVPPLAYRMLESLETYINLDLPFHLEQRREQVERVRQSLNSADFESSEQLRQVLELYDIEMQYSTTIDTYDAFVETEDGEREVNILRWGRMSLIYLSKDERSVGIFDATSRSWKPLSLSYRNAVRSGLRMARKQASLDIVLLPVAAAVSASTDEEMSP